MGRPFERCTPKPGVGRWTKPSPRLWPSTPNVPAHDHPERESADPHGLSPREIEVLRLLADGRSSQEIADALFLSLRTVTTHITGILGKLNCSSRTAAVAFAIRSGIA